MKYHVTANSCDFGIIDASSEKEAKDKACQMSGYQSEQDMIERLEEKSEIVCELIEERL